MTDKQKEISYLDFKRNPPRLLYGCTSRECSLMGRREVLTGKAKFGIFGAGKELAQIAWAKAFKKVILEAILPRSDLHDGFGRIKSIGFFNSLYAVTDIKHEPMAAGGK